MTPPVVTTFQYGQPVPEFMWVERVATCTPNPDRDEAVRVQYGAFPTHSMVWVDRREGWRPVALQPIGVCAGCGAVAPLMRLGVGWQECRECGWRA